MEASFTPNPNNDPKILEKYARNLTDLALKGKLDPIIGREDEIRRITRVLSRRTKNNPILIGEPGVGKTAIVEGLAFKIVKGDIPDDLKDKEIYELDLTALIAGASFQGQFEERIKAVINFIKKTEGKIILFIDEIHMLIGTGRTQGAMDAANILKPAMARGEIKIIGATTLKEYKQWIEKDPALERRMQKVEVPEPSTIDTINILRGIKDKYETYHGVSIHDNALVAAVDLSNRYIQDRFLPDKAIDLLDEACALVKSQIESMPEELEKDTVIVKRLKIEEAALKGEKDLKSKERLIEVEKELKEIEPRVLSLTKEWEKEKSLINSLKEAKVAVEKLNYELERFTNLGQFEKASEIKYQKLPKAEKDLQHALKESEKSKLKEEVTQETIATIISRVTGIPVESLVDSEKIKLSNLENEIKRYMKGQEEAITAVSNIIKRSRLGLNDPNKPIGSFIFMGPTGTGKTELAKSLARVLFSSEKELIRFDMSEFSEKHSVSKLIGAPAGYVGFEEGGLLTDAVRRKPYSILLFDEIEKAHEDIANIFLQILDDGRLTDSHGRVVNFKNTVIIMTSNIGSDILMSGKKDEKEILSQLGKFFRPEFINRVDEIVTFKPLEQNVVAQIAGKELNILISRLKAKNIILSYSELATSKIAKDGFDPLFGARPIKRYIAKNIESLIAQKLMDNQMVPEVSYRLDVKDNHFVIDKLRGS